MQTKLFREHHATLRALVGQMPQSMADLNESKVKSTLIKLSGLLKAHLRLEDEHLYPAMRAHPEGHVRAKAEAFQREMNGLTVAYRAFYDRWIVPRAIEADAAGFVHDWTALRGALASRMDREDGDLYALADEKVRLSA